MIDDKTPASEITLRELIFKDILCAILANSAVVPDVPDTRSCTTPYWEQRLSMVEIFTNEAIKRMNKHESTH